MVPLFLNPVIFNNLYNIFPRLRNCTFINCTKNITIHIFFNRLKVITNNYVNIVDIHHHVKIPIFRFNTTN